MTKEEEEEDEEEMRFFQSQTNKPELSYQSSTIENKRQRSKKKSLFNQPQATNSNHEVQNK